IVAVVLANPEAVRVGVRLDRGNRRPGRARTIIGDAIALLDGARMRACVPFVAVAGARGVPGGLSASGHARGSDAVAVAVGVGEPDRRRGAACHAVTAAAVERSGATTENAPPHEHLRAGPHGRVASPGGRRTSEGKRSPGVAGG